MMKTTRERSRGSLKTEVRYLQAVGLRLFPGSAAEVAALPSEMGSFQWTFVEYKGQNGFAFVVFLP